MRSDLQEQALFREGHAPTCPLSAPLGREGGSGGMGRATREALRGGLARPGGPEAQTAVRNQRRGERLHPKMRRRAPGRAHAARHRVGRRPQGRHEDEIPRCCPVVCVPDARRAFATGLVAEDVGEPTSRTASLLGRRGGFVATSKRSVSRPTDGCSTHRVSTSTGRRLPCAQRFDAQTLLTGSGKGRAAVSRRRQRPTAKATARVRPVAAVAVGRAPSTTRKVATLTGLVRRGGRASRGRRRERLDDHRLAAFASQRCSR
jgi:hypothetical protein